MNNIQLTKNEFLSKGGERDCFINPNDNNKVIKVLHTKGEHNHQNELEYIYSNYLEQKGVLFTHITKCFGWTNTNKGRGLIFERVVDYDNKDTKTFRYYVKNHLLDENTEIELLNELKYYLIKNTILFIDVSLANVFCKKIAENKYKLIIFDGLGARRKGFKFNLYMKLHYFSKYKINKQWKKFISNYYRDKNSIK